MKPVRYTTDDDHPEAVYVHEQGYLVKWDDYAALAAENERLRSKLSFSQSISEICNQPLEGETITVKGSISSGKTNLSSLCQCERLAAENERLRKAGDEVALHYAEHIEIEAGETAKTLMRTLPVLKAWLAAKEGGAK